MLVHDLHPLLIVNNGLLRVVSERKEKITLKVLDKEGRITKSLTTLLEGNGIQDLFLNLSDLKSGTYILNTFCGGMFLKSIKFIKS